MQGEEGGLKNLLVVGHISVEISLLVNYLFDAPHISNTIFSKGRKIFRSLMQGSYPIRESKFPDYSRFSLTFCKNGLFSRLSRFSRFFRFSMSPVMAASSFPALYSTNRLSNKYNHMLGGL